MDTYTVQSFTTRGSTCQTFRFRLLKNGKRTTTEFSSHSDAKAYAALRNLREFSREQGFALCMEDHEILKKIALL